MNNPVEYKNILVHALVNLGDVLLSTSAIVLLRQAYPDARVTMMVRPDAEGLVKNNPSIDEVIIYDYKKQTRSLKDHLYFIKELRKRRFDLAISLDRKLRPSLLTCLAGIPTRVGADRLFDNKSAWFTKLYTHTIKMPPDIANRLQVANYQEVVRQFTGLKGSAVPVMAIPTAVEEKNARQLMDSLPQARYRIALCVKGTFALKNWPPEYFAAVIDTLATRYDAVFFIIGAPGDKEYADYVISLTQTPVANFCGLTNLPELAALLKMAHLFITVDTGAAHIGATTGVPMVVIFGCTSPKRWRPQCNNASVLSRNLDCCPCSYPADGCPHEKACLQEIKVVDVLMAVKERLGE